MWHDSGLCKRIPIDYVLLATDLFYMYYDASLNCHVFELNQLHIKRVVFRQSQLKANVSWASPRKVGFCFILKGVDLVDHTSIFLLRTINHYVTLIMCTLSWFVPTGTSSEFFPPEYPPHWDIPTRSLDIPLGYGLYQTRFTSDVVLERKLLWIYNSNYPN